MAAEASLSNELEFVVDEDEEIANGMALMLLLLLLLMFAAGVANDT